MTLSALAGLASGALGAFAYYNDWLSPLSHTFVLWIVLTVLVSARTTLRRATVTATAALLGAVLAFYPAKELGYLLRFPGGEFSLNPAQLALWSLLAVVAGPVLGPVFRHVGTASHRAGLSTAAAVGLVIADACHRGFAHPREWPALSAYVVIALAAVCAAARGMPREQSRRAVVMTLPAAAICYLLVSAPDVLEQLLWT